MQRYTFCSAVRYCCIVHFASTRVCVLMMPAHEHVVKCKSGYTTRYRTWCYWCAFWRFRKMVGLCAFSWWLEVIRATPWKYPVQTLIVNSRGLSLSSVLVFSLPFCMLTLGKCNCLLGIKSNFYYQLFRIHHQNVNLLKPFFCSQTHMLFFCP